MKQQPNTPARTHGHELFASPWMDTESAAIYLSCQPGTLKTWRAQGVGPRYHVINRKLVRYHREELDAYLQGERAPGDKRPSRN